MTYHQPHRTAVFLIVAIGAICGCDSRKTYAPIANLERVKDIRAAFKTVSSDTQQAAVVVANPTGFATLRGVFRVDGEVPAAELLVVNKDVEVCAPGGRSVVSEEVTVSDSGELANVLVYATNVRDEWAHESARPGNTEPVSFDQKECRFLTRVTAIQSTQPLQIFNSDSVGHNTKLAPRANTPFDQTVPAGSQPLTYQASAEEREPFTVVCAIHPWMKAWLITRKNSYFAVTAADGSFEIPNLPAGVELEFRAWQERVKFLQNVTVNENSEKWKKGKFTHTLENDEVRELTVVVAASELK